ncbi:MAG: nickel-dependent lactate racemase [Bryobacteraceae bacterium]|jgi:nickel-dependent lactate racemase
MNVEMAFGRHGLRLELPEGPAPASARWLLLEPRWATPLDDPRAATEQALDHPVAGPPLEELARGRESAAISVCDITRPAPNQLTLPPLLERLQRAGIARQDITILIATGLHRPATPEEIAAIVGPEVSSQYRVENHFARRQEEHRHLGTTSRGTPVWIDRRFTDAGLRITLGFIEQHLMAGFSGGRKLIAPGLAYQETIRALHSPRFMRDPNAREGSIEHNPLHAELLEIAALAKHDFALDVALAPGRRICGVFAGEPRASHAAGIEFVRDRTTASIPGLFDAAITSAAGYPLDLTFYQAVKGVTAAAHIVKPGGPILLLAECAEGAGAAEFSRLLLESPSPAAFLERIERASVEIDQWQLEKLALVFQSHPVLFHVPGLPAEFRATLWGPAFDSAPQAVAALVSILPDAARVAVLPEGPYVFARPAARQAEPAAV